MKNLLKKKLVKVLSQRIIITIIILLILAVVTIGSIKNNNIITYAQNASRDYNQAKTGEKSTISRYESLIESNLTGESKVTYTDDGVPIPSGFYYVTGTKETGLVISDNASDENKESGKSGSQFVWIPVSQINDMIMCQEHGASVTLDEETLQCQTCGEDTKLAGKLYSTTTGEYFDSSRTGQRYSESGLREPANLTDKQTWSSETTVNGTTVAAGTSYIYDSQEMFTLYGAGTYSDTMYQEEFDVMVKSVAKYGGFYVGRYETSLSGQIAQSKAGQMPMNNITWYEMYKNSKTYSKSGIVSEMIWGCQWDAMLKFILKGENADHVTSKENVGHTLADFTSLSYQTGGENYSEVYTGSIGYNDIASNIYDLEGNVRECTQEANATQCRISRGGYFSVSSSPSARGQVFTDMGFSNCGSRLTLYIEL